jgi:hypothetical protein
VAAQAPGVVAEAPTRYHHPHLVGDDGDGAQVVGVEVARQRGLIGVLDVDADQVAADDQVVGPALRPAELAEALRQHAHAREIQRHPVGAGRA